MTEQTTAEARRSRAKIWARFGLEGLASPRGPVDLAAPQHGVDHPDQLPGGEDEAPLVLVAGRLLVLDGVVGTELRAVLAHRVGSLDQVVAQVAVPGLGELPVLALELPALVAPPGEAGELGELLLVVEPGDVAHLRHDAGREHRPQSG